MSNSDKQIKNGDEYVRAAIDVVAEALCGHTGYSQDDIVVEELTPLHQHVGEYLVGGDLYGGHDPRRHQSGARLGKSFIFNIAAPSWLPMPTSSFNLVTIC